MGKEMEGLQSLYQDITQAENEDFKVALEQYEEDRQTEELKVLKLLDEEQEKRDRSKYQKRSVKESARKRGGLKQESPFFDDGE